jgi:hypothetical protein
MKIRAAFIVAALLAIPAAAAHAAPSTATATASVDIVAPANVATQRQLQFGTLARPTTGASTFTVASSAAAAQTPSETGAGDGYVPIQNQAFAAQFRITALAGQTYSVTQNALSFVNAAGNLTNVSSETPTAGSGSVGTVPAGGTQDLFVGGRLTIDSNTAVATYNGTLTFTVDFQ